jgi:cytochrome b6-f complex iron-sulfur subunit
MNQNENMNRGQFIRELGMSSAALMAFYCLGTATTSCTTKSTDPTPTPTPTPTPSATGLTGNADPSKGKIDFTLDLNVNTYSSLKTAGSYLNVGEVFIAFAKGNKYVALSKNCTHQNNPLKYRIAQDNILCDTHGSEFKTDGSVDKGPATKALVSYKTSISTDGNTLTIKE